MGGGLVGRTIQYMALYRYRVLQRLVVPFPGGYVPIGEYGMRVVDPYLYYVVGNYTGESFDPDNYGNLYVDRTKGEVPDNIYTDMDFNAETFQTVISTTNIMTYERPANLAIRTDRPKFKNAPIPVFFKADENSADWITETWYSFSDRNHWLPGRYTSVFDVGSYPVTFHDNPESFMIGAGIQGSDYKEPSENMPLTAWYENPWDTSPNPTIKDITQEELGAVYKNYAEVTPWHKTRNFVWSGKAWIKKEATTLTGPEVNKNYVVTSQTYSYEFPTLSSNKKYTYYLGDRVTGLYRTDFAEGWINIGNGWIQEAYLSEILT